MGPLNEQIEHCDTRIAELSDDDEVVARLQTVPGVGPVTAAAFRSMLDDVDRFESAHQVEAYLGLVPREFSSAERQRKGSITKAGNGRLRWLLVEAAWTIQRSVQPEVVPLQSWARRIRDRRGKRVATVALGRRVAGILYAMWRDETDYSPERLRTGRPRHQAAA